MPTLDDEIWELHIIFRCPHRTIYTYLEELVVMISLKKKHYTAVRSIQIVYLSKTTSTAMKKYIDYNCILQNILYWKSCLNISTKVL